MTIKPFLHETSLARRVERLKILRKPRLRAKDASKAQLQNLREKRSYGRGRKTYQENFAILPRLCPGPGAFSAWDRISQTASIVTSRDDDGHDRQKRREEDGAGGDALPRTIAGSVAANAESVLIGPMQRIVDHRGGVEQSGGAMHDLGLKEIDGARPAGERGGGTDHETFPFDSIRLNLINRDCMKEFGGAERTRKLMTIAKGRPKSCRRKKRGLSGPGRDRLV